jgi:hypothetical protein
MRLRKRPDDLDDVLASIPVETTKLEKVAYLLDHSPSSADPTTVTPRLRRKSRRLEF